jgi:hypothetical protein
MSLSVADHTQTAWLQAFNEPGEMILGTTASELHDMKVRTAFDPVVLFA